MKYLGVIAGRHLNFVEYAKHTWDESDGDGEKHYSGGRQDMGRRNGYEKKSV